MQDSNFLTNLSHLWNFQLFAIDGSSITLGKVVVGLLFSVMGYYFSNILSRAIGKRLIRRLQIQKSFHYTLERLSFYIIYVFVILFILQLLSIPITIFTVVGGALAIGIGFGSQNVVNNFISGIIVMVEQPVRVGDWVELEGVFGQVQQIGGRSTVMRTLQDKETIIPNSFFLEKMFTNWTLSNNMVVSSVSVGVAYGSNVNLVKATLLQAAAEHPDVLKSPGPSVVFQSFGDSSLNFDLYIRILFTSEITSAGVASDLRFRIDELFREKKITIPFPHRELIVHAAAKGSDLT